MFRLTSQYLVEVSGRLVQILRIEVDEPEPEVRFALRRSQRDRSLKFSPGLGLVLQSGECHPQSTMTGGIVRAHRDVPGKLLARVFKLRQPQEGTSQIVKSERIVGAHFQRALEGLNCVLPQGYLQRNGSEFGVNIRIVRRIFPGVHQKRQGFFGVSRCRCSACLILQDAHQSA